MFIRQTLFCISAVLFLVGCSGPKALTSNIKADEIQDLQKFETFSFITLIEKGNRGMYNDTISKQSKDLFTNLLKSFRHKIPVTGELYTNDVHARNRMQKEIEYICVSADKNQNIASLRITPTLDSLLETNNKRFGLVTVTVGFTRRKGNYAGQIAKGVGVGILTLGLFMPTPIKANSTIYAAIVDAREDKVIYFHKSFMQDKEPLDVVVLSDQIERLFKNYFWE
jgi:hypothetical protein